MKEAQDGKPGIWTPLALQAARKCQGAPLVGWASMGLSLSSWIGWVRK